MIKLCYALRTITGLLAIGAVGSIELDQIGLWTGFLQMMLGITTWLLTSYWLDECKIYENKKSPLVKSEKF